MPVNAILCDWNGTVIQYRNESPLLESVAKDLFKASIPLHPLRMARILRAKKELKSLQMEANHEAEYDVVKETFRIYNTKIINGVPASLIRRSVATYAHRRQTQDKLDYRLLRPVKECHQAGKSTGIFSAGYGYGIEMILTVAGYNTYFDFYEADHLCEVSGRAIGFGLNIYKRKPELLLQLIGDRNIDARRTAYLGDSEDDEGCFEIVRYPVVAFFATDALKQRCARKYKAFVPEDEADLANYFGSA